MTQAVKSGNTAVAQVLVDKGVDLDIQNSYGLTASTIARQNGNVEMIQIFEGEMVNRCLSFMYIFVEVD